MTRYARHDEILIEPVGHLWATFSPRTGETSLLNDESVAILEVLELGERDTAEVCAALGEGDETSTHSLHALVEASWPRLIQAGLVRKVSAGQSMPK